MAARLGNVLYWLGWMAAVPLGLFSALIFWSHYIAGPILGPPHNSIEAVKSAEKFRDEEVILGLELAGLSFVCWLVGRLCRYVLAAR